MKKLAQFISLVLFFFAFAANANQPVVKTLRFQTVGNNLNLFLGLTETVQPKIFTLQNPNRLVIDLPNFRLASAIPPIPADAYFITDIHTGKWDGKALRVVLGLNQPVSMGNTINYWFTPNTQPGNRSLVVAIKISGDASLKHYPPSAKTEPLLVPIRPAPEIPEYPRTDTRSIMVGSRTSPVVFTDPRLPTSSNAGSTTETVSSDLPAVQTTSRLRPEYQNNRDLRDLIVAIDPGHGGKDTGAVGPSGICEKDVVLAISRRLADHINAEPGMKAVLTRSTDIFIPLHRRVVIAREHNADLFIAIHADASPSNSEAQGASVFTLSERGASSTAARLIADKENAADLVGGVAINDKDDLLVSVLLNMSLSATMEASRQAADIMLDHLYSIGEIHKEKVQYAGFAVLKAPDVPGMLVETAYISNPKEEYKLSHGAPQERIAQAIFDGVREYFHVRPPQGTKMAQVAMQRSAYREGDIAQSALSRYRDAR